MSSPRLALDSVSVKFGNSILPDDLSLIVAEHEFACVIGTSGGGKTTMLRAIAGLVPVSSGVITLAGTRVTARSRRVAMVFQHFGLFPWKTVRANVAYGLRVQKRDVDQRRIDDLLSTLHLNGVADYYPAQLSGKAYDVLLGAEGVFPVNTGLSAATITATIATMKQYKILSGPEPSEASIVNTGPITSVISKLGTWTGDPRWN